jgi:hypothetical protein
MPQGIYTARPAKKNKTKKIKIKTYDKEHDNTKIQIREACT